MKKPNIGEIRRNLFSLFTADAITPQIGLKIHADKDK
ncbi:hypothetical protein DR85_826 [Francisella tularensis]|nr:hypothetical protein DR85_826 [Francisella tularensis]